jgi:chromosome partitioning protein
MVGTLEQELADEIGRELKLTEVINDIKNLYDYILIDCPPSLGFLTVNAIRASDEIILPVETSRFAMQGVDHLMDIANLIRDRLNHPVKAKVLITMFDSRLRHSFTMLGKMKEKFTGMLFDTIVHINVKLKEAAVMGEAVIKYDKYCRGTKDYMSLAREILTLDRLPDYEPSERMRVLIKNETGEFIGATAFVIKAPQAKSVYVTGTFNDWSLDENARMTNNDGIWTLKVNLKPGTYKYQFIVDGKWQEDPANTSVERNSFGDINSLIEVKA